MVLRSDKPFEYIREYWKHFLECGDPGRTLFDMSREEVEALEKQYEMKVSTKVREMLEAKWRQSNDT